MAEQLEQFVVERGHDIAAGETTQHPALRILQGARIHDADPELAIERKAPACTADEFAGYVWNEGGGRRKGEEPLDKDNHGMDMTRYAVAYVDNLGDPSSWATRSDYLDRLTQLMKPG